MRDDDEAEDLANGELSAQKKKRILIEGKMEWRERNFLKERVSVEGKIKIGRYQNNIGMIL